MISSCRDVPFLQAIYGSCIDLRKHDVDRAISEKFELYLIDNKILAFKINNRYALTVRGLIEFEPDKFWVTVDIINIGPHRCDPRFAEYLAIWYRDFTRFGKLHRGRKEPYVGRWISAI